MILWRNSHKNSEKNIKCKFLWKFCISWFAKLSKEKHSYLWWSIHINFYEERMAKRIHKFFSLWNLKMFGFIRNYKYVSNGIINTLGIFAWKPIWWVHSMVNFPSCFSQTTHDPFWQTAASWMLNKKVVCCCILCCVCTCEENYHRRK